MVSTAFYGFKNYHTHIQYLLQAKSIKLKKKKATYQYGRLNLRREIRKSTISVLLHTLQSTFTYTAFLKNLSSLLVR